MTAPYYQDDLVTLYHGDWRELIGDLRADCIVTDPPYGETSLDWDHWPVGWPALAAPHARSMWCFGSMRMLLDRRDEFPPWRLSQDVVWEKHNGSGFASDRFKRVHEFATHWYQGAWADVHHATPAVAGTPRPSARIGSRQSGVHLGKIDPGGYEYGDSRLARSVIYAASMHRRAINETEKPFAVLEPLITYACPPGGLVVDLFAGSGSTLVAARNLGLRAVGFEMREEQCEKSASQRLAQGVLDFAESAAVTR